MWLRRGDSEKQLAGKVIWVIGRRDSGKTTLVDALQKAMAQSSQTRGVIIIDDFLRCRTAIRGKDVPAYNQMIGLSWALAYQGFDCLVPAGARSRALRDHIRENIPQARFVYLAGRGRPCGDYEDPEPDEAVLTLDAKATVEQEVKEVLAQIWEIYEWKTNDTNA
jgi:energy-coupling factor transporter ATP-binding protein EcfA2